MSVKNQWKLLVGGLGARRPSASPAHSAAREFLERSRLVAALIFIVTVAAIVFISSAGMTSLRLPVQPGQTATVRVVAAAPFSYVSAEKTRAAREQFLDRVPPVYRLEFETLRDFEAAARDLLSRLATFELSRPPAAPGLPPARGELAAIAAAFNSRGAYRTGAEDLAALLAAGDAKARAAIFETGLTVLRELYAEGIHDAALGNDALGSVTVFQIATPGNAPAPRPVHSLEDALTILRVSLATEGVPRPSAQALFRFFRNGVTANVVFDRTATQQRETEAARSLQPVSVNVVRGQTIIEPGERVTPEQYEMFTAHRRYLMEHGDAELNESLVLFGRVLLVLAMVLASIIYIRIEDPETLRSNVRLGLLPVLESLFKRTTDITLLELTDYNHPLLRRMQLEAPGTYHHSLVVAQLAENAANAIGANPLLARVCALFHDIGKTAQPAYFTENQRDRQNPHDDHAPADSARIIKRHVSDGVELAVRHQLPRSVIDVIRQHHGTTLVRYFYDQAVTLSKAPFAPASHPETPVLAAPQSAISPRPSPIPDDAPFRYDGPRPQFKESAVISLADGVEAASRSLRSADAAQLNALIDKIVLDRIAEKQLDEAPLTFEDIARIKNSFQFTLLNMLHARVAYPALEPAARGQQSDAS